MAIVHCCAIEAHGEWSSDAACSGMVTALWLFWLFMHECCVRDRWRGSRLQGQHLSHHPIMEWSNSETHENYRCTESSKSTPGRILSSCEFFLDKQIGFFLDSRGRRLFLKARAHRLRGNNRRVQRNAQTQRYSRRGQKRAQRSHKAVSGDPPQPAQRARTRRRARRRRALNHVHPPA